MPQAFAIRICSLALLALSMDAGVAAVPITANFIDGGSASEEWSDLQKSTFNSAMNYLGSVFLPTYEGEAWTVDAYLKVPAQSNVLAYASPLAFETYTVNNVSLEYAASLYNTVQGKEALTGPVARITFNPNVTWNYSTTPAGVQPGDNSFYTTAVHEMSHGLGFLSLLNQDQDGTWYGDIPSPYDANLGLMSGGTTTSLLGLTQAERAAAYTSNAIYWTGEAGNAGNPADIPIQIFAPNPAQAGSSISHIDPRVSPDSLLMYPYALNDRIESFTFSAMELGMFDDMGYTVVPEPEAGWLVLFAGAGLLCWRLRRQKARRAIS